MKSLSLEYCHVTPGLDASKEVKEANERMPGILRMLDDFSIQKCIMVDDVHATKPADGEFLQLLVSELEIKPDCIYLESSFIKMAHEVVEVIDTKKVDFVYSKDSVWLKENKVRYRSNKEFLLKWENNTTKDVEFSCPTLAATSYLFRLGYIKNGVEPIRGGRIVVSDNVINVLSSQYLQVESDAQSIISVTFKEALDKLSWLFY